MLTTVHSGEVDGARPVAGSIDSTALLEIVAKRAFQLDIHRTHLGMTVTTGGGSNRSQVTTRRKTAGSDERGIELILLGLTTHEADDGTDVVQLGRPLGIHAGTVVRTYHGIASIKQRLANSTEVSHTLAVVAEPSTAIDMNHNGIAGSLLFGQIDVAGVIGLVVADIVYIFPLL